MPSLVMRKNPNLDFYGSYTRILLALMLQERGLKEKIFGVKPKQETSAINFPQPIMDAELKAALLNPISNGIVKNAMRACAARVEQTNTVSKLEEDCSLADREIEQLGKITDTGAKQKLKLLSEKNATSFQQTKQLEKQDAKLQENTEELLVQQYQAVQAYRTTYSEKLCEALEQNGVKLNDAEKAEILNPKEDIATLVKWYADQNLPLPIPKNELSEKPGNFFYLLAERATRASLSRRLEPHTPADVNGKISALKGFFQEADGGHKKIQDEQQKEIGKLQAQTQANKQQAEIISRQLVQIGYETKQIEIAQQKQHPGKQQQPQENAPWQLGMDTKITGGKTR